MRASSSLAALAAAALLGACAHRRERVPVLLEEGALAPPETSAEQLASTAGTAKRSAKSGRGSIAEYRAGLAAAREPEGLDVDGRQARDPGVRDAVPVSLAAAEASVVRTSTAPAPHQPLPAGMDLAQAARETFLSCDSEVVADKATLFVPERYAAEVRLADDGTTLRLRRLTIRARTLKVTVRTDSDDLSITARGNVSFHADRPASRLSETGLRSLLIRNDGHTPLR